MARRTMRVQIGSDLHLIVGDESEVVFFNNQREEIIQALTPDGHAAHFLDEGLSIFVQDGVLVQPGQEGSRMYIWDKTGNRVKCWRNRVTVNHKTGAIKHEHLGYVYKKWEV